MTEIELLAQHELRINMKDAVGGWRDYCPARLPRVWDNIIDNVGLGTVFNALSALSMVRIDAEPDNLPFDDLVGDMFDEQHADTIPGGMRELKAQRDRMLKRLDKEGQWIHIGKAKAPNQHWLVVDSVGGFIGDDFVGSGQDNDVRRACVNHILTELGLPEWHDITSEVRDRALLCFTMLALSGVPIRQHWINNATWDYTRS